MSDKIGIWSMTQSKKGKEIATPLEELNSTETEQRLEDLLVESPDLLGVDPDGQIVLFELKRGTLTRDAVAQILDYASDLTGRDSDDFANLIESNSGRLGIDRINDFTEWFSTEFSNLSEPKLDNIRLVLVGLGVDMAAKRIVNLLAREGLDIQLLTFQAFRREEEILLARHIETVEPKGRGTSSVGGTKEGNRKILEELAREQNVLELLTEVSDFLSEHMPMAYRWPNKTAFTYAMNDVTDSGRPTQRSYGALWVDPKQRGRLIFSLPDRAIDSAKEAVNSIVNNIPEARLTSNSWTPFELPITSNSWPDIRKDLEKLVREVVKGWKNHMSNSDGNIEGE